MTIWWRVLNTGQVAHATQVDGPDNQRAACGAGPGVWRNVPGAVRCPICKVELAEEPR